MSLTSSTIFSPSYFDKQCHKVQAICFPFSSVKYLCHAKVSFVALSKAKTLNVQHATITCKDILLYSPSSWNNLQIQFLNSNNFSISAVFHLFLIVPEGSRWKSTIYWKECTTKEKKCYSTRELLKCIIRAAVNFEKIFY